ncbi:MAG: DUF3024 domain-containing protein [Deltaproteobacteria bacterium]|nr:DUF3024 domain-containing protein [Deltaproteobacteria bacterium]MBK8011749.1 DUF3024 domain-containing protein [Deltaproteobacteria bacterium]MBK8011769.1 DUF3024 domain-containing protein [Deltaproteobacteria bacterium]
MPLPRLVRHLSDTKFTDFYERRIPLDVRNQVRMAHSFRGNSVTVFEERPHWQDASQWSKIPIAQVRYDAAQWQLYWADRNGKWHIYDSLQPQKDFDRVIREIDADLTRIFFG